MNEPDYIKALIEWTLKYSAHDFWTSPKSVHEHLQGIATKAQVQHNAETGDGK